MGSKTVRPRGAAAILKGDGGTARHAGGRVNPAERPLTGAEVAAALGMSMTWVYRQWRTGRLPGYRIGNGDQGALRFWWSEIEPLLQARRRGPSDPQRLRSVG